MTKTYFNGLTEVQCLIFIQEVSPRLKRHKLIILNAFQILLSSAVKLPKSYKSSCRLSPVAPDIQLDLSDRATSTNQCSDTNGQVWRLLPVTSC